ncbi:carbohydrate ABC transporter permease [Microbacterium sp. EST19A]|uniref:carbohydrate ABC transporter permease n=1 Tax=Microbacterium sp. EST19A TaxID=2862681 RepID=UPI001CBD1AF0|nr:carbohydrate ABC transporter permease [Microbacterium sp. EST19A]
MIAKVSRWGILLVYSILIIVPLTVVIFGSFKSSQELFSAPFAPPSAPSLANYETLFGTADLGTPFVNSVIVTAVSLLLALFIGSLAAYAVARIPGWRGWLIFGVLVLGMSIPAQAIMVPLYVMFASMGLLNSLVGLILIEVVHSLPITVFILGGFMKTLPRELYEASSIDGSGPWRTYWSIVLPLSTPSIAATAIFLFVIIWNDLLFPLLFVQDAAYETLPLALLGFQGEFQTNYPAMFAGVIIASMPVVVAYIFLQRYFVAGITAGASKG